MRWGQAAAIGGLIVTMTVLNTRAAGQAVTPLPHPRERGTMSLEETLARRRSVRDLTSTGITSAELGQLCWAAQGVTASSGLRTAPSAGALYPLELYVVTADGVLHYRPGSHGTAPQRAGDLRKALQQAAGGQAAIGQAPVVFVLVAVYERTAVKYGEGRARRYAQLEAGHAAQNLLLQTVALGLGAVPIGAFDDRQVQAVLGLPAEQEPLYLIPVGHARE
jgi:SagB-type dehydrogenase family enzyme